MSVGRLCTRSVVFATDREKVRTAAQRMARHNVGSIVVVDEGRVPVGIFTDRDIVVRCVAVDLDPVTTAVGDVMTTPVRTVGEMVPIQEALRIMRMLGVRRLVVTGEGGALAGILSLDDVLELLASEADTIGELLSKETPTLV